MDVDANRRQETEGGLGEDEGVKEEECNEEVTERGKYYDLEVEVPGSGSDEETLSDPEHVPDDVSVLDITYEPPECISLVSGVLS